MTRPRRTLAGDLAEFQAACQHLRDEVLDALGREVVEILVVTACIVAMSALAFGLLGAWAGWW